MEEELDIIKYLEHESKESILEYLKNQRNLQRVIDDPPTEERVCKALSDYFDRQVVFSNSITNGMAMFFFVEGTKICQYNYASATISVFENLPPRLGKMIFEFYEAQEYEVE